MRRCSIFHDLYIIMKFLEIFVFQWTLFQGAAFGVLALTILVSLVSQFLSAFFISCVVVAVIIQLYP